MLLRVRSFVGVVLASGLMAGCVDDLGAKFSGRWGPNPAIPAATVDTVAQNQYLVLSYLARPRAAAWSLKTGFFRRGPPVTGTTSQWGFQRRAPGLRDLPG
jgi:hypothetical protein